MKWYRIRTNRSVDRDRFIICSKLSSTYLEEKGNKSQGSCSNRENVFHQAAECVIVTPTNF